MKYLNLAIAGAFLFLVGYWLCRWYMNADLRSKPHRQEAVSAVDSDADRSRLKLACGGNDAVVDRLIDHEKRRDPSISLDEAARRALERLARDRGSIV